MGCYPAGRFGCGEAGRGTFQTAQNRACILIYTCWASVRFFISLFVLRVGGAGWLSRVASSNRRRRKIAVQSGEQGLVPFQRYQSLTQRGRHI